MNLLLTSVSAKTNLVAMFKEAAEPWQVKVFGCDMSSDVKAASIVDEFIQVKSTSEPGFTEDLINLCKENEINFVIPTRDGDIAILAKYHNNFLNAGIKLLAPDLDMIQICQNKQYFNEWLARFGYPSLKTYDVLDVGKEDFPLFSRPIVGAASLGAVTLRKMEDLKLADIGFVTEFVEATEYSIDVLMDLHGRALQAVVRSRDKIENGEAVISTIVYHPELVEKSLQISRDLRLIGHNVLQAFEKPDGEFVFFDVNMRFGGSSDLSVKAGLNSPARLLTMQYGNLKEKKAAKLPSDISVGLQLDRQAENPFTLL